MRLILAAHISLLFPAPAAAAEITAGGDSYMGCIATISGQIEKDDSYDLEDVLFDIAYDRGEEDRIQQFGSLLDSPFDGERICLDSPGGSFNEAMYLGDMLAEWELGTAVARGARCESACAVVFMAGRQTVDHDSAQTAPNRLLHAGGVLGFHAPALNVPGGRYSEQQVRRAYGLAIESIAAIVVRKVDWQISDNLLDVMLRTPPERMARVETVFQSVTWDIPLVGTVLPDKLTPLAAAFACTKAYALALLNDPALMGTVQFDQFSLVGSNGQLSSDTRGQTMRMDGYGFQDNERSCFVHIEAMPPTEGRAPPIFGLNVDPWASLTLGEAPATGIPPVWMFDSNAKIADLVAPDDTRVTFADPVETTQPRKDSKTDAECTSFEGEEIAARLRCTSHVLWTLDENLVVSARHVVRFENGTVATILQPDVSRRDATVNGIPSVRLFSEDDPPVAEALCYRAKERPARFCVRAIFGPITIPKPKP